MSLSTVAHETFVIERIYDVPVAQTFRAWADPLLKARCLPVLLKSGSCYELDFRVGGRETNRGGPPGGPVYTYESEFRDIIPEQRIVYTYEMFADESRISVSVATVLFSGHDATSQLVLTEQGVFLDGHDTVAQRGGRNPFPPGLACSKLEKWRIVRKTRWTDFWVGRLFLIRRRLETRTQTPSTSALSKEFLNVTSSCSQLCSFARRLRHR